jgi:hypothetical protein
MSKTGYIQWLFEVVVFFLYFDAGVCDDCHFVGVLDEYDFRFVELLCCDVSLIEEVYDDEASVLGDKSHCSIVTDEDSSWIPHIVAECYVGAAKNEALLRIDNAVFVIDKNITLSAKREVEMIEDKII